MRHHRRDAARLVGTYGGLDTRLREPNPFSAGKSQPGSDATKPACAPPSAKLILSYGSTSGVDIEIPLPSGEVATVGVDGTGSAAGEDGGPAIASYDWTVGGTNLGGSSSFSSN